MLPRLTPHCCIIYPTHHLSLSLIKFMGFPVNYTDFLLPRLAVQSIKASISFLLHFLGLLGPGIVSFPGPLASVPEPGSISASFVWELVRELLLPTARFSDLAGLPEGCAVCLDEFEGDDEIQQLENCCHVYHRGCLDHWMAHDQCTCPLCRKPLVPDYVGDTMNEVLWAATPNFRVLCLRSGISRNSMIQSIDIVPS